MRILIAEDDLTSRSMLAAVLKKAGDEITATVNSLVSTSLMLPAYSTLIDSIRPGASVAARQPICSARLK